MLCNLSHGFIERGLCVDFLIKKVKGPYLPSLPQEIRIIELGTSHSFKVLPALIRYLKQEQPEILLSAKEKASYVAVLAGLLIDVPTHIILRVGTTVSEVLKNRNPLKKFTNILTMRLLYTQAHTIIAVSKGVAEDIANLTSITVDRIKVVPNPVVTPELPFLAKKSVDHPWFNGEGPPIIIGVGRLSRAKDFGTLIQAFSQVHNKMPCRLLILGKGRQGPKLRSLATELGINDDFCLPGFVDNPYPYIAKSNLFALSSLWEGSPNALIEALALGIPAVATDCKSGPREILRDGRYGKLVPIKDSTALAEAIVETLQNPLDVDIIKSAAEPYRIEMSTDGYLSAMGIKL